MAGDSTVLAQTAGDAAGGFVALGALFFLFVLALVAVSLGLWIWALVDAVQTPDGYYRSGTKTTWILVLVLAGGIGAIIYFAAARPSAEVRAWLAQARAAGYVPPPPGYAAAPYGYGSPQPYGAPPAVYGPPPGPGPYGADVPSSTRPPSP